MPDSTVRVGGQLVDVTTRYRIGGILVPARTVETDPVGATLASETWTGADGAPWPAQWATVDSSGGTATIQANAGRMTITSTYGGNNQKWLSGMTAAADVDLLIDILPTGSESTPIVAVRSPEGVKASHMLPSTGYWFFWGDDGVHLGKMVGYTETAFATVPLARTGTVPTRFRYRAKGTALKLKAWASDAAEPTAWLWTTTDNSITAPGKVWVSLASGGTANISATFDNLTVRAAS